LLPVDQAVAAIHQRAIAQALWEFCGSGEATGERLPRVKLAIMWNREISLATTQSDDKFIY
jgi:hypothetical protein